MDAISARLQELERIRRQLLEEDTILRAEARELKQWYRATPVLVSSTPLAEFSSGSIGPLWRSSGSTWTVRRVRNLLLWLGGGLLVLSGVSFAAVLWSRDQPQGKPLWTAPRLAILLLVVTLVLAVATWLMSTRLPVTAEVLATLVLAAVALDWFVLYRAGVGDGTSLTSWMSIGCALVAVLAIAERHLLHVASPTVTAPLLALAALGLAVLPAANGPAVFGAVAAGCAAVAVGSAAAVGRTVTWSDSAVVLVLGAVAVEGVAVGGAVAAIADMAEGDVLAASGVGAALAVAALSVPLIVALVACREPLRSEPDVRDVLDGCVALLLVGAVVVLLAASLTPPAVLTAVAWIGALLLGAGVAQWTRGRGASAIGVIAVAAGASLAVARSVTASLLPLSWWTEPWTLALGAAAVDYLQPQEAPVYDDWWWAVAAGLAVVAAAVVSQRGPSAWTVVREAASWIAIIAVAVIATFLVPMAADFAVWAVLAIELAAAAVCVLVAARADRWAGVLLAGAFTVAVAASGWAIASRPATIVASAVAAVVAGAGAVVSRPATLRPLLSATAIVATAAAVAAIVLAAGSGTPGAAAFGAGCVGTIALVAVRVVSREWRLGIEIGGVVCVVVGLAVAASDPNWLAATATVAVVALAVSASGGGHVVDGPLAHAALPIGVAVTVAAWLHAAGVEAVEAYTLPMGIALVASGVLVNRSHPDLGSWVLYAAGLLVLFVPSLVLYLAEGGRARLVVLAAGGIAAVVIGAVLRLQSPMLIGGGTLVSLGIHGLAPAVAAVPPWIPLALAGLAILWVGATFERRMGSVRHVREGLRGLR